MGSPGTGLQNGKMLYLKQNKTKIKKHTGKVPHMKWVVLEEALAMWQLLGVTDGRGKV